MVARSPPESRGQALTGRGVQVVTEIVGQHDGACDVGGRHRLGDREHARRRGTVRRQRQRPGLIQREGRLQPAQQGVDRAVVRDEPDPARGVRRPPARTTFLPSLQPGPWYLNARIEGSRYMPVFAGT
jgi:hypothetical protein